MKLPSLHQLIQSPTTWLEKQQNSILSAAAVITTAYIISSLSGLIRQRLLLGTYFDTEQLQLAYEAFLVAFQIPDFIFQLLIMGALSAAFIPIFSTHKKTNPQQAFEMSSIMMNVLLLAFVVFGGVVFVFAKPLTMLLTGTKFTPEQVQTAANLTRIMIGAQFFFAVSNFMTGILQSYQRFIIPSLAPILYNLGIVLGVFFLSPMFGIYAAGIGVIIGAFLHMIIQLPWVLKLGFRYKFSFNLDYPGIVEFLLLMPPRTFSIAISEFRKFSLTFFATSLGNLSLVIMQLALTIMTIPIRFFGVPISQASLPFLTEETAESDKERFRTLVLQSLHQIAFFTFPMAVLILILRVPIVRITFGTDNFPWWATLSTGRVLALLSISIAAQAMVHLLLRAFYALKDTLTPFIIAVVDLLLYLGLSSVLVFWFKLDVLGLAIATTVSAIVELFLFLILLELKVKGFMGKAFWIPQLKMVVASFLMAVFLYLPFKILDELVFDTTRTIELITLAISTGTIGMLVYLYFAALFDIHELQMVLRLLNKFGGWQAPLRKSPEVLVDATLDGDEV